MSRRRTKYPSLVVPELLQGQWTTAIICTFGANLTFFESRLMGQLAQVPLRIILADDAQLSSKLYEAARTGQRLRWTNKAYVAAPIRHSRAAHAKLILLLGPSKGKLIAGSGNLGYDGYASPGELWHVYSYDDERPEHLNEFIAARSFLDGLATRELLDAPVIELLQTAWGASTWLPQSTSEQTSLRSNLEQPLITQLRDAAVEPVAELIAHAPFHDQDCAALSELDATFKPKKLRLMVTRGTSADPGSIKQVLGRARTRTVEVVEVKDEPSAYLHAKWVHLIHAHHETMLSGSANLSRSALLRSSSGGNIEIGVISTGPRGSFAGFYEHLEAQPVRDIDNLGISYIEPSNGEIETEKPYLVALWCRLDRSRLTITFSADVPPTATVDLKDDADRDLSVESTSVDGNTVTIILDAMSADRLSDGGHLSVCIDGDEDTRSIIWPYHLSDLRRRLDKASQREQLPKLGNLPEQDAELFDLLRELDQTLIIDRESIWRVATPRPRPGDEKDSNDGAGSSIELGEIDWNRVRRDPRYRAYLSTPRTTAAAPTDIQVILAAIAGRLGGLGISPPGPGDDDDDGNNLGNPGDTGLSSESEDIDDQLEDELTRRRLPISTRTRMAFDRFVRRYSNALMDAAFIEELGPIVATTNAVIFNHVLSRLLEREAVSPHHALSAQAATWRFLWGDDNHPGITKNLDNETLKVVRKTLTDADARADTLRGLAGSISYDADQDILMMLRDVTRHLFTDPEFDLDAGLLAEAAGGEEVSAVLLGALSHVTEWHFDHELLELVLSPLGLKASSAGWRSERVQRLVHGSRSDYRSETFVITTQVKSLSIDIVRGLLQRVAVATYFAGHDGDYVRVRLEGNGKAVAYWDANAESGAAMIDDEIVEMNEFDSPWPDWSIRIDELREEIGGEATSLGSSA